MSDKSVDYAIVKGVADDNELEDYRICFEKNGTPRDIKNLQWLHQKNLAKTNMIYYAMYNNNVAAIYTAMPVLFRINGGIYKALQSIDTITDISHRGKGLFPKLASKLYTDASENNFELVYGFPNENSAPGFFKKLNWLAYGEAPFMMKPFNISYFIKKALNRNKIKDFNSNSINIIMPPLKAIGKNKTLKQIHHFNESYDLIWQKTAANIGVSVDRTAAYMNWRYIDKPDEVYYNYGLYIDGKLEGVVVFTVKIKHGGTIGYIMELIYNSDIPSTGKLLLKSVSELFKKAKVDAALAWSLPHSFNYQCFRKSGYFNLPVRFRPQHLFLGVRSFSNSNKNLIEDFKNWYISYSDSDTV